jgi:hypothetical protein
VNRAHPDAPHATPESRQSAPPDLQLLHARETSGGSGLDHCGRLSVLGGFRRGAAKPRCVPGVPERSVAVAWHVGPRAYFRVTTREWSEVELGSYWRPTQAVIRVRTPDGRVAAITTGAVVEHRIVRVFHEAGLHRECKGDRPRTPSRPAAAPDSGSSIRRPLRGRLRGHPLGVGTLVGLTRQGRAEGVGIAAGPSPPDTCPSGLPARSSSVPPPC